MTETIKQKALALLNKARAKLGFPPFDRCDRSFYAHEALCRAIEQHEAFKREVSDAVEAVFAGYHDAPIPWVVMRRKLEPFIIPKPDPLVEAWNDMFPRGDCGNCVDKEGEEYPSSQYSGFAAMIAEEIEAGEPFK